jgi:hypothetical protein
MERKPTEPYKLVKVPIIEPLTLQNVYEHTPLDVYKYGEYPRFIRPVGAHQPRFEIVKERNHGN